MEEWRVIPKHPKYDISNLGRMRRKNKTYQQRPSSTISEYRYLKGSCNQDGYRYVKIGDKCVYFTHLVLEAFVCPRPAGLQCDHINRIRDDNRLVNLRWVTKSENMRNRVYSVEGRAALIGREEQLDRRKASRYEPVREEPSPQKRPIY